VGIFGFIKILLRGAAQVMFQCNSWCGLLFIVGIFWGAYSSGMPEVGWGALLGVMVSTATGFILNLQQEEGFEGLWGFNGILVGCAFPTFLGNTVWMWFALALCAALTTWVRTGLNNLMRGWGINSLPSPLCCVCVSSCWLRIRCTQYLRSTLRRTCCLPCTAYIFTWALMGLGRSLRCGCVASRRSF